MRLNPKHLTLNELLLGRLFRIPEYQRAYAWGKKQRDELFQDIREVRENGQDYFMATIVSLARGKRTIGADEFISSEVVDGQQRLADSRRHPNPLPAIGEREKFLPRFYEQPA